MTSCGQQATRVAGWRIGLVGGSYCCNECCVLMLLLCLFSYPEEEEDTEVIKRSTLRELLGKVKSTFLYNTRAHYRANAALATLDRR